MRLGFRPLLKALLWLGKPLLWWIASKVTPDDLRNNLKIKSLVPVLYVLQKKSYVDFLVLYHLCKRGMLPVPEYRVRELTGAPGGGACLFASNPRRWNHRRQNSRSSGLYNLVEWLRADSKREVQIVPVSIFWGKDPGKDESSLFKLLFSDDERAGFIRKIFILLAHGRNNIVQFGSPISLRRFVGENESNDRIVRKTKMLLRYYFRNIRDVIVGKKLYDRAGIISRIVQSPAVQQVISEKSQGAKRGAKCRWEAKAASYGREICADLTYSMIRFAVVLLSRLWHKMFDGIEVRNVDYIKELAGKNYEIVYVPNHRSHLDYLLVNYIIYTSDLAIPHNAAGINLNFWPIGGFLRRTGAFFIRRSFKGNKLYTVVFNEYLKYLLTGGYPVLYFHEGGRSRTGRLLKPKTGFLAMIVKIYLQNPKRPIVFVPININYDKLFELRSYLKELSGGQKRKESLWQLINVRKTLKNYLGKAYINFGEPVFLEEYLKSTKRRLSGQEVLWSGNSSLFNSLINELADHINVKINAAIYMNPISLIALGLLAPSQKAMSKEEMIGYLQCLVKLQHNFHYSDHVCIAGGTIETYLDQSERLGSFQKFKHVGGDIFYLAEVESIYMSYYKNSILHLFALPSLVARCFLYNTKLHIDTLIDVFKELYPFLKEEFFLRWKENEIDGVVRLLCRVMSNLSLLIPSDDGKSYQRPLVDSAEYGYLQFLARSLGLVFEKYSITVGLLAEYAKKGFVSAGEFDHQCHRMMQRLAILNGIKNPDSAVKALPDHHIRYLKRNNYIISEGGSKLVVDRKVLCLFKKLKIVLSPDTLHSIGRITTVKDS